MRKIEQDGWVTLHPKIGDPQSHYERARKFSHLDERFERVFRKNAKTYLKIWQEFLDGKEDEDGSDLPRS